MMRCPNCGRSLVGLRQDHPSLCSQQLLMQSMREEHQHTVRQSTATEDQPRNQAPSNRQQVHGEARIVALLDGTMTRAEADQVAKDQQAA